MIDKEFEKRNKLIADLRLGDFIKEAHSNNNEMLELVAKEYDERATSPAYIAPERQLYKDMARYMRRIIKHRGMMAGKELDS